MRYVIARTKTELNETAYRIYMSDSIFHYAHNKALSIRYEELLHRKPVPKKDAQQIVDETLLKAGLKLKE